MKCCGFSPAFCQRVKKIKYESQYTFVRAHCRVCVWCNKERYERKVNNTVEFTKNCKV